MYYLCGKFKIIYVDYTDFRNDCTDFFDCTDLEKAAAFFQQKIKSEFENPNSEII